MTIPPARPSALVIGAAMMLGASAVFAGTTLMAKAVGQGVGGVPLHPLQVSAGRFCFAFIGICIISLYLRPTMAGANWRIHATRSLFGWGAVTCVFAASALMPLADAIAISFLSPVVTMLLAIPLLGERVGKWRWIAAGLSFAGAIILIQPGTSAFQVAALIALAAAALQGAEAIAIKHLADNEPPLRILLINNAFGAVIALTAASFVWQAPSAMQWVILALIGLSMLCAQTLFIQAMRRGELHDPVLLRHGPVQRLLRLRRLRRNPRPRHLPRRHPHHRRRHPAGLPRACGQAADEYGRIDQVTLDVIQHRPARPAIHVSAPALG